MNNEVKRLLFHVTTATVAAVFVIIAITLFLAPNAKAQSAESIAPPALDPHLPTRITAHCRSDGSASIRMVMAFEFLEDATNVTLRHELLTTRSDTPEHIASTFIAITNSGKTFTGYVRLSDSWAKFHTEESFGTALRAFFNLRSMSGNFYSCPYAGEPLAPQPLYMPPPENLYASLDNIAEMYCDDDGTELFELTIYHTRNDAGFTLVQAISLAGSKRLVTINFIDRMNRGHIAGQEAHGYVFLNNQWHGPFNEIEFRQMNDALEKNLGIDQKQFHVCPRVN